MRNHPHNWKGGKKEKHGTPYTMILTPGHHRADVDGYVREHILIAEKAIGKSLPNRAEVHHHTPEQLVICQDRSYHFLLHQRARALAACGHTNWRKCHFCHQYDNPVNLTITQRSGRPNGQTHSFHNKCHAEYEANRREVRKAEAQYRRAGP